MRILKYAILGLIYRTPLTGYDITKEFHDKSLANFWYARHSQVYPELNRLLKEGLLSMEVIIQGEKMEKKIYSITEQGKKEFYAWLEKDEDLEKTPKDKFRLRTYFSDFMSDELLKNHLESQLERRKLKLSFLENILSTDYKTKPKRDTKEFGDFIVLEGAIIRESAYINWLENTLLYLK